MAASSPSGVPTTEKNMNGRAKTGNDFDVYGDEQTADIKYRTMHWWKAAALMLAETVSLGILSIPSVFASLGMVAGCILVVSLGAVATATGYQIGQFKLRHPHVHNMADAGMVLGGPVWREILGTAQVVFLIFVCGSHVLTGLIAFDTITSGASCSITWAAVTAALGFALTLPRTLDGISYLSVASFVSIMSAVLITMIGVGVTGHQGGVGVTSHLNFANGFLAVTDVIFAYAGHVAFLTFISEMADPRDFPKALLALQLADTTLYLVVGVVVYAFAGAHTVSPALGNTGRTLRRVAYGVALPTIVVAGVINGHVCAKLALVRVFRMDGGRVSPHMARHTKKGWATWIGICAGIWALAFVIAEVIPFFNDLLGVISALFASWFTYGISGVFWFHLNPAGTRWTTAARKLQAVFWGAIVLRGQAGAFIMVAGLYASIWSIVKGYQSGSFPSPFSCVNRALA
ncbi:hypothetical protein NEOLEDRAFT_1171718 [Neolentinus lepideus HHB14362 ss-1]|uniref:Amino acid transporter transmembrane domain-containing protein n=1 Tax=Neolentinus lepideus HHB14362 ss-1 TaxID=1314782 RepID=A0A165Q2Q7_9AGAM|nr:hypothetical protein NEOLEDRAFT_1171718 [Neolentinus lepideus HHB14362 ss-1]